MLNSKHVWIIIFQILLITDLSLLGLAKKGGGGVGRGGSRTSGNSGRGHANPPPRVQPAPPRNNNYGSKTGSGSSGLGKVALGGVAGTLVGGIAGYQLGKAVHSHGGRNYYFGDQSYRHSGPGRLTCRKELEHEVTVEGRYSTTTMIFECNARTEYCCVDTCCSNFPWWAILLIVLAIVGLVACCAFGGMKYSKQRRNTRFTSGEASVPLQATTTDYANGGGKAYAAQPAMYPAYPNQPAWQQPVYGGYPQPAPAYGFNVQPSGPYRQY